MFLRYESGGAFIFLNITRSNGRARNKKISIKMFKCLHISTRDGGVKKKLIEILL